MTMVFDLHFVDDVDLYLCDADDITYGDTVAEPGDDLYRELLAIYFEVGKGEFNATFRPGDKHYDRMAQLFDKIA